MELVKEREELGRTHTQKYTHTHTHTHKRKHTSSPFLHHPPPVSHSPPMMVGPATALCFFLWSLPTALFLTQALFLTFPSRANTHIHKQAQIHTTGFVKMWQALLLSVRVCCLFMRLKCVYFSSKLSKKGAFYFLLLFSVFFSENTALFWRI